MSRVSLRSDRISSRLIYQVYSGCFSLHNKFGVRSGHLLNQQVFASYSSSPSLYSLDLMFTVLVDYSIASAQMLVFAAKTVLQ